GMRLAGHVPAEVGLARALAAGYWSIDHLDGYAEAMVPEGTTGGGGFFGLSLARNLDEARIDSLAKETRAAGVWNVPTEVLIDNIVAGEEPDVMAQWPEMRYVSPRTVEGWTDRTNRQRDAVALEARWRFVSIRHQLIKALYDAGAGVVLGSDAPQVWNVPGFSAHRELALMVDAGLTPYQAMEIATSNVARFLDAQDESGTIAVGKRADLILLDANPLADITATSRRAGVMLRGRWLSRAEIEERLAQFANP
ncbi:MAG: amidohydrolase family protein, partial [Gemmatimonadales bacterium]|nr:amidohydrolase family protein [Gemmatimonadales bacterium]